MLHKVKLLSGFYQAVIDGIKPFEIRYNDRNYRKGDDIIFNEWKDDAYTGRLCCAVIKDVFDIGFLMPGYVAFTFQILGIFEEIEKSDIQTVTQDNFSFEYGIVVFKHRFSIKRSLNDYEETVDVFQRRLRHIFLNMCNGNDYDTLNLLQIDSAIEALYDTYIAELKKKYTEDGK